MRVPKWLVGAAHTWSTGCSTRGGQCRARTPAPCREEPSAKWSSKAGACMCAVARACWRWRVGALCLGQTNLRVIGTSRDHVLGQPPANSAPLIAEPPRHRRNSASHAPSADLIGGIPPPTRLSHADLICGIPHPTRLSHDFCRGRIQRNCGIPHPQKGPKWLRVWKARPFFFDGSAIF